MINELSTNISLENQLKWELLKNRKSEDLQFPIVSNALRKM